MKLCFYTTTALPKRGGQESVIDELARQFVKLGHEVTVLAPQPRRRFKTDDSRLPYRVVRHPRFYSTHRFVEWYRWFLLRLFEQERFDVIHCHGIHPPGYIAALCRNRINVPLVMTCHGDELDNSNPRLSRLDVRQRTVRALAAADALIAISAFVEEGYRRLCPSAALITHIGNGVYLADTAATQSRPGNLPPSIMSGQYWLFLGRLKQRKGVDCLIRAFSLHNNETAKSLVIAGDGDEKAALMTLVSQLGLEERVHFVGWVDGSVKTYLLQNSFGVVVPSERPEAFGIVVLESYAAGRPVVATAVAGLQELVEDQRTGVLVPPGSDEALAHWLEQLEADREWADLMGRQARQKALQYCWSNIAERHLDLYKSLSARRE
jgi:glycosyltransferase involved in cell wall biosynthesis